MLPLTPNLLHFSNHFPNYYASNHLLAANFTNQSSNSTVNLKPLIPINPLLDLSLSQPQVILKRNKRADAEDIEGGETWLKWNPRMNPPEKKMTETKRASATDNICSSPGDYMASISDQDIITFHKRGTAEDPGDKAHTNCGIFDVRDHLYKFFLENPDKNVYKLEVFIQGHEASPVDIQAVNVQNVNNFKNYLRDQLNRQLNYSSNELKFYTVYKKRKAIPSFICKKDGNINEQSCKEAVADLVTTSLQCDLQGEALTAEINNQCPSVITTTTSSTSTTTTTQKPKTTTKATPLTTPSTTTPTPTSTTTTTTTQKPTITTKPTPSTTPATIPTTSTTTTTQKPTITTTSAIKSTTSSTTTTSTPITTKTSTTIKPITHRPLPPPPPRAPDNRLARCLKAPTEPGNYEVARLSLLGNTNDYCSIWANQTEAGWQLSNGNGNVEAIRAMINGGTFITSNNDTCLRQQFKLDYICGINPQTGRIDPNTAVFTDNNYAFCDSSYSSNNNLLSSAIVRNRLIEKLNRKCPLPAVTTERPERQTPVSTTPAALPEDNFSPQINYGGLTYKGEGTSKNLKKGLQKACAHYHIKTASNPTPKAGKVKCNEESESLYLTALACDEFEKEVSREELIELFQDDCRTGAKGLTSTSAQQGPLQEYTFTNSRTSGRTQFSLFSYNPQLTKAHRAELLDNRAVKIKCSTGLQPLTDIQIERATTFTELCPTAVTVPVTIAPPREETPIIEYGNDRNEALLRSYAGYTEDGQAPKLTTVRCNSKEFYILREPLERSKLPIQEIAEEIKLDCHAVKYNAYNAVTYLTSNATAAAANPEVYNKVQLQNRGSAIYLNIANGAELNEAHRKYLENNELLHYKCTGKLGWESFSLAPQGLRVNLDEKIKAVENMCSPGSTTTIATTIATTPFISRNLTAECHVPYRSYNPEEDAENSNLISTNPENLVSRRRGFSARGDWEFDIRAKMSKAPPSHYDRFWAKVSAPDHEGACSIRGWIDENEPFKVSNGRGIEMITKFCENDEPFTVAVGTLNNVEREILEHEKTTTMLPLKDAKGELCPLPSELEALDPHLVGRQLEEETQGIIMKKLVKKIVEVNPELQHSSTQAPTTTQQPTIPSIITQKPSTSTIPTTGPTTSTTAKTTTTQKSTIIKRTKLTTTKKPPVSTTPTTVPTTSTTTTTQNSTTTEPSTTTTSTAKNATFSTTITELITTPNNTATGAVSTAATSTTITTQTPTNASSAEMPKSPKNNTRAWWEWAGITVGSLLLGGGGLLLAFLTVCRTCPDLALSRKCNRFWSKRDYGGPHTNQDTEQGNQLLINNMEMKNRREDDFQNTKNERTESGNTTSTIVSTEAGPSAALNDVGIESQEYVRLISPREVN